MRVRRTFKRLLTWIVVVATLIGTGPTIWRDAIANVQTYLHTSETVAMVTVIVPIGVILLVVAFVRVRNWLKVQRQHRSVRKDALRNLRL